MTAGQIEVAQQEGVQIIRLQGDVRLNLCTAFERYIKDELSEKPFNNILIDLSGAEGIDSTSLGQLAKIAILGRQRYGIMPTVYSPRSGITRILMSMGFDAVFHIIEAPFNNEAEFREWVDDTIDEEQAREHVISAHRVLMDLNETNRQTFSELVETLECSKHF
ncbi:STAS domain-containing protein [Oceanobacter mangrovi]|uniref:STAS domain-containing protein n=1 Tax=Oceanobacter mangrovi TaxID=2862510 RepID=UPI001C8DDD07|nr:STAS domain-containing protein [Oceanobacter mangrovi]